MMRSVDMFSGIGGMALALRGYARPILYCEIDEACRAVAGGWWLPEARHQRLHWALRCGQRAQRASRRDGRERAQEELILGPRALEQRSV